MRVNFHQHLQFIMYCGLALGFITQMNWASAASDWQVGAYVGQYYDSEPAGFSQGKANYLTQYMIALNVNKTVWRAEALPLSLEMDGMLGHQFGLASLQEIAVAPALRWHSFPWNEILPTNFRVAPLGISYTSVISPLERSPNGSGSHTLNFLFIELGFSNQQQHSNEIFLRLHHRCAIYDLLNNYGANGEDFFVVGYRQAY